MYFLEKYDGLSELVAFTQNWGILQTGIGERWDHMKMSLDYFQIQNWKLQRVRAEEVDEKNGVICLTPVFPFGVMIFKLSKNVHFLQFCADLSKKPKSVEAICI